MAFDYVNFSGLSHFYDKIKTKFASKDDLANKMDKSNPTGTGSLSLNRESGTTIGTNSIALGTYNGATASGNYSVALGGYNWGNGKKLIASGYQSTAIGAGAQSTANDTVAIGTVSSASGNYSMALGFGSKANGSYSVAMNRGTTNGSGSVAIGKFTVTNGDDSTAIGLGTVTGSDFQTALGKYNIEDTSGDYVYIVGNGSDSARSNAHTLDWDGNAEFSGDVIAYGCGGTTPISLNELNSRPVNNNLLINSNFANPVNQREIISPVFNDSEYSGLYCIDRWELGVKSQLTINENKSITLNCVDGFNSGISQFINDTKILIGKPVTLSAKINGKVYSSSTNALNTNNTAGQAVYRKYDDNNVLQWLFYVQYYVDSDKSIENFKVCLTKTADCTEPMEIEWAKLELGEVATPYVPRLYEEELQLCQRYYQPLFVRQSASFCAWGTYYTYITLPCKMRLSSPTISVTEARVMFATTDGNFTDSEDINVSRTVGNADKNECEVQFKLGDSLSTLNLSDLPTFGGIICLDAEI